MGASIIEQGRTSGRIKLRGCLDETRAGNFIDRSIEALVVVLFAFMPLSFGAVQAWGEEFVILAAGLIAVLFCAKLVLLPQERLVRTWAYIPAALFALIAVVQLIPLPAWLANIISPNAVALRTQLWGDIPNSGSHLKNVPLSLYPAATKHDLQLLLSAAVVFVVVLNVFRRPAQIKRLLWSIALIGGVVAAITLAQNIFGNGKIYWFISTANSRGYSGPFINHSNYGQFMNLSIAAALAVLVVYLGEAFSHRTASVPRVFDYIGSSSAGKMWLLIGIVSICLATVFVSLTRGGIISMLASTAFTVAVLAHTGSVKRQWWLFCLIFLVAFSCVLYTGFDAVFERLATLRNFSSADSGRLQILKDIGVAWQKFPLVGTGFGTHRYVYPMFDRSYIAQLAAHAENEYAEVIEETGALGLITLSAFGIIIFRQYFKCVHNRNIIICRAAYGLGFGIVAILVHSVVDFGQHIPANGMLTAAFCAILIVLAKQDVSNDETSNCCGKRWLRMVVTVCVCLTWFWALGKADSRRVAEGHWNRAQALEKQLTETDGQTAEYRRARIVHHVSAAVKSNPEDVKYLYWLSTYRYRMLGGAIDPYSEISLADEEMVQVQDIANQLRQVCLLCPTYGEAYSMLGQIEKYVLYEKSGSENIRKGFRLAKNDPVVCFAAACSDASEGDIDSASQKFARAVKLDGRLYKKAAMIYIDQLSRPDLAIEGAGTNAEHLYQAAFILDEAQYKDYAEQARQQLTNMLDEQCQGDGAQAWQYRMLGECYAVQGQTQAAIDCYRRALKLEYNHVGWRLELAQLLYECDRAKEAMDEARVCLQLRPDFADAKNLLARCAVRPSVLKESINQN